jgi:hypothetical protein
MYDYENATGLFFHPRVQLYHGLKKFFRLEKMWEFMEGNR